MQCRPSTASLLPTARLQGEPMSFGCLPELLSAIMVQLLKCFVVQHDASSFPMSSDDRAGLSTRVHARSCSPSLPFRVELRVRETPCLVGTIVDGGPRKWRAELRRYSARSGTGDLRHEGERPVDAIDRCISQTDLLSRWGRARRSGTKLRSLPTYTCAVKYLTEIQLANRTTH